MYVRAHEKGLNEGKLYLGPGKKVAQGVKGGLLEMSWDLAFPISPRPQQDAGGATVFLVFD